MARKLSPVRSLNSLSRKTQVDLGCRPSDVGGLDLAKVRLHAGGMPLSSRTMKLDRHLQP